MTSAHESATHLASAIEHFTAIRNGSFAVSTELVEHSFAASKTTEVDA